MIDKYAVNEIVLYIENDAQLYRSMYQPIVLNYAKKVVAKTFNREKAIKGVVNLVDAGIKKYRREMGAEGSREFGLGPGVKMDTKVAAAKLLLSGMMEEIRDQVARLKKTKKLSRRN
jgi:hypothetical protein